MPASMRPPTLILRLEILAIGTRAIQATRRGRVLASRAGVTSMRTNLFSRKRLFVGLGVLATIGGVLFAYGCSSNDESTPTDDAKDGGGTTTYDGSSSSGDSGGPKADAATARARANIKPTADGGTIQGTATFEELPGGGVKMTAAISGAPPGLHGFHIHQVGDCGAAPDGGAPGTAAGSHWNVGDAGHGYPDGGMHHTGDMGNIVIGQNGVGSYVFESSDWTIAPGTYSVVGHSVIFHAGTDDGVSQPTGDAGARPGCGVIVLE